VPIPFGVTRPTPVMTTRSISTLRPEGGRSQAPRRARVKEREQEARARKFQALAAKRKSQITKDLASRAPEGALARRVQIRASRTSRTSRTSQTSQTKVERRSRPSGRPAGPTSSRGY
jgi:hypothetical protein